MRVQLRHYWEVLTSGYWFVPAVMTMLGGVLALVLLHIDRSLMGKSERLGWLYGGGSDGASTLLSTVAGSVITVAGVVFSITIAALTQASSQFGPRLLRNFMRDTSNQVVLGTFVATFLFCLLVLRTIHGKLTDGEAFVPQASVTTGVLLAMASIAVLIYFIHHVSVSLQSPSVVAAVRDDLEEVIDRLSDDQVGAAVDRSDGAELHVPLDFDERAQAVTSTRSGYVQAVDYAGLTRYARDSHLLLRLAYRPGDYVIEGSVLFWAYPADQWRDELSERCNVAFICGSHATAEQDVEYAIRQMVEVAVRALSPGINDPFTAINCIDNLGSAVCRIAHCGLPGPMRYDEDGVRRLITPVTTFDGAVDIAFNQIRQYGADSVAVMIRLLEVIAACGAQINEDSQRQTLFRHAKVIYEQSTDSKWHACDRDDIRIRWEKISQVFGNAPGKTMAT